MKKEIQYRWAIKTDNVYTFAMFYGDGFNASTLASYKNEVSGFIRSTNLPKLLNALLPYGFSFKDKNIKLVKSSTYMKNWDKYNS
jgi:hypothetical protein